jgi:hypothetical protein
VTCSRMRQCVFLSISYLTATQRVVGRPQACCSDGRDRLSYLWATWARCGLRYGPSNTFTARARSLGRVRLLSVSEQRTARLAAFAFHHVTHLGHGRLERHATAMAQKECWAPAGSPERTTPSPRGRYHAPNAYSCVLDCRARSTAQHRRRPPTTTRPRETFNDGPHHIPSHSSFCHHRQFGSLIAALDRRSFCDLKIALSARQPTLRASVLHPAGGDATPTR